MHRPGVTRDEHVERRQDAGEVDKRERTGDVDVRHITHASHDLAHHRAIGLRARQHDRGAVIANELARDIGEPIEMPLFRFAAAAGVNTHDRPLERADEGTRAFTRGVG
jgi:hypothetical protein